ncbi:MAG: cryptochrome/photolyase family protein [Methanolinea sp.]|nr:cryptochrome/photolyase family protein [Methanolinea sp.]
MTVPRAPGGEGSVTLVLPHQLFAGSPALSPGRDVVLVEDPWFFRRLRFCAQKLVFHRASMRAYRDALEGNGYHVKYIDSAAAGTTSDYLRDLARAGVREIHLCDPVERGLAREIAEACSVAGIRAVVHETPMFLCDEEYVHSVFGAMERYSLTPFYIAQRKRLGILVGEDGRPAGGRWTFDVYNREPLPAGTGVPRPWTPRRNAYVGEAIEYVRENFPGAPGDTSGFCWPVTHDDAERWFRDFLSRRLALFGPYQDAISREETFLFHSAASPLLNCGLLSPRHVVEWTLSHAREEDVPLASLEGFVRQVVGWREFVRGVYEVAGERQRAANVLGHSRDIPPSFWTGRTGIDPVDTVVRRVLAHGYCHHIERLMVLGNFMLLCGFSPRSVYEWFSALFIDAYDWVMVPNVFGMSQFADGGLMSTKPYVSGSRYLLRMSDFSRGDWCEVWDALFWRFAWVHRDLLSKNPRFAPLASRAARMPGEVRAALLGRAEEFLATL